jgi:hypothetical protein
MGRHGPKRCGVVGETGRLQVSTDHWQAGIKIGDVVWVMVEGNQINDQHIYRTKECAEREDMYGGDRIIPVRLVPVEDKDTHAPAPLPTPEEVAEQAHAELKTLLTERNHFISEKFKELFADAIRADRERRGK